MHKVLIIDDDEGILDAVSLVLEDAGYEVDIEFKGNEVFHKISTFKPEVILLDMLLSGNDGRTICRQLKADKQLKTIPVIMISAHPNAHHGATEAGAEDFLAKPFNTETLLEKVKLYL